MLEDAPLTTPQAEEGTMPEFAPPVAGTAYFTPTPEIISSVPGFERPVAEVAQQVVADAELGSGENPIVSDNGTFKGDPRRVIGHPSNPNSAASQAYGEHLSTQDK